MTTKGLEALNSNLDLTPHYLPLENILYLSLVKVCIQTSLSLIDCSYLLPVGGLGRRGPFTLGSRPWHSLFLCTVALSADWVSWPWSLLCYLPNNTSKRGNSLKYCQINWLAVRWIISEQRTKACYPWAGSLLSKLLIKLVWQPFWTKH